MSRIPNNTDFQVSVDDIGTFTFARRRLRDEMAIGAEVSRLTEGVDTPTPFLAIVSGWVGTLKVLTVAAPDGWDLDEMDPLEDDTYSKLAKVHKALREKEGSFRKNPVKEVEGGGQVGGKES